VKPIDKSYDIFIFGYGSRAKNDIIPVVDTVFPKSNKFIYATTRKKVNINGEIVTIKSFSDYSGTYKLENNIAFISVPPSEQLRVFNKINNELFKFDRIFIDTPIVEKSLIDMSNIEVLEDFPFSPIGSVFKHLQKKRGGGLIFYRCLFKYHGVSLLRTLLGSVNSMRKISFRLARYKFTFVFSSCIILIVSPRKYEICKVLTSNYFFNPKRLNIEYISHDNYVEVDGYKVDLINSYEQSFLTSCKKIDVFKNIDMFKKIGLSRLIYRSITVNKIQYSCAKAYYDYINGENI